MDTNKLVGKILVKARYIPSTQVIETTILFEDRDDSIYYCWTFTDSSGTLIAGNCLPISKRIIDIDEFDYAINHAKFSIDQCRISRQKIFEVLEIQKLFPSEVPLNRFCQCLHAGLCEMAMGTAYRTGIGHLRRLLLSFNVLTTCRFEKAYLICDGKCFMA